MKRQENRDYEHKSDHITDMRSADWIQLKFTSIDQQGKNQPELIYLSIFSRLLHSNICNKKAITYFISFINLLCFIYSQEACLRIIAYARCIYDNSSFWISSFRYSLANRNCCRFVCKLGSYSDYEIALCFLKQN